MLVIDICKINKNKIIRNKIGNFAFENKKKEKIRRNYVETSQKDH